MDNIKVNYPAVATDIIKEAEKRAAETKEIEEAHKDGMWEDMQNPEEEKNNLEKLYGTPLGFKNNNFLPKMFDIASKRSSFTGAASSSYEELVQNKFSKLKRKNSTEFKKKIPNENFRKLKNLLPKRYNSSKNLKNLMSQNFQEIRKKSKLQMEEEKDNLLLKGRDSFKEQDV